MSIYTILNRNVSTRNVFPVQAKSSVRSQGLEPKTNTKCVTNVRVHYLDFYSPRCNKFLSGIKKN